MMELPEAVTISRQMETLAGRRIAEAEAGHTPHKFAFYCAKPPQMERLLAGQTITATEGLGGFVRLAFEGDDRLLLGDGVRIRLYAGGEPLPPKRQLVLRFSGGAALVCSVQMYGGMWVFKEGAYENPYYLAAQQKPSPLSDAFDAAYFKGLWDATPPKLSAKAFLGTEQRVPGLGNGALQDIFFKAGVHPRRRLGDMGDAERERLYTALKATLADMTERGGRDTEQDLYGSPGGYRTMLSAKTAGTPCPVCGQTIQKQAYLGGSIYFCSACQPL